MSQVFRRELNEESEEYGDKLKKHIIPIVYADAGRGSKSLCSGVAFRTTRKVLVIFGKMKQSRRKRNQRLGSTSRTRF